MKRFLEKCLICILVVMLISNFIMSTPVSFVYASESEKLEEVKVVQGEKKDYYQSGAQASNPDVELGNGGNDGSASASTADDKKEKNEPEESVEEDAEASGEKKGLFDYIFSGIVGIFTWIPRALLMAIAMGLNSILTAFVKIGGGSVESVGGASGADDFFVTPFHIFFNKIELLNANFLDLTTENSTVLIFRQAVAGWYYSMRLIATMALLVILAYIGIRMAISTIASEKALYKKMLVDWVTSLALLFLLHYIMIFVFACNDALVGAMGEIAQDTDMVTFMTNLQNKGFALVPSSVVLSFAAIIVYSMIVFQTLSFILTYIKRMLTIGFLIIIAPLITITYSIDKIGDQKAQALNVWLKEFSYNILIQPFHCILFLSFAKVAMDLLSKDISGDTTSLATAVLAVLCIQYIKTGEDLIKKIFGFDKAGSLATMAAGTAMAMAAMSKGGEAGKLVGKGVATVGKVAGKTTKNTIGKAGNLARKGVDKLGNTKGGKFVKGKLNEFKQRSVDRAAEKDEKKAYARAMKANNGEPPTKEAVNDAMKGIVEARVAKAQNREETKAKITGAAGKVGKGISKGAKYVANSDVGKYMAANASKVAGVMIGTVVGSAGLANGTAGAIAGYKMGSGFMEGLMPNALATINKDMNQNAQAISNLDGSTDATSILYEAKTIGDNDGFKDMQKAMQEVINKLNKLGINNGSQVVGNIAKDIHNNPASVNRDSIRDTLARNDEKFSQLSTSEQDAAIDLVANQAKFMAQASLYKNMTAAGQYDRSIDDMASKIGGLSPHSSYSDRNQINTTEEHIVEEEITEVKITPDQVDISKLKTDLGRAIEDQLANVKASLNSDELISQLKSASPQQQEVILKRIQNEHESGGHELTVDEVERLLKNEK